MSLTIIGNHEQKTIDQMNRCLEMPGAHKGVLCADGHLGYAQPVGGVIAYRDKISISGVGFDIACGNKAAKTNIKGSDIKDKDWPKLADQIARNISFGIGRVNNDPVEHELFDDETWKIEPVKQFKQTAQAQLGTVGSGNHYVDVFLDEDDNVWVGVHFGSRGLGHKTASHFLLVAGGKDGMDVPPTVLDANSALGEDYIRCMELAGKYAYAGRDYVVDLVVKDIFGGQIVDQIHNHHNYAWKEKHGGDDYWVVRKGATPAFPGQRGFVGGSMGGKSVILRGVDSAASQDALYSTVHGSGRIMSRTQAAGKVKWIRGDDGKKRPQRVTEGLVNEASMRQKIKNQGIELRGGGADEAPDVYRQLEDVLAQHAGTIEIENWLNPKIVVMAGADIHDPFKD